MTHPRTYKRPVEEVARALCNRRSKTQPRGGKDRWDTLTMWARWERMEEGRGTFSTEERQGFIDDAKAVLTTLRDPGFINDIGLESIKAEEMSVDKLPEGWMAWAGGPCPVATGTLVDFRRRSGEVVEAVPNASEFNWGRYSYEVPTDIIAYRIKAEEEEAAKK